MFNTLILSGGGIKGIAFIGCIKYLDEIKLINNFKTYVGSSVGSLTALLLCIGYRYDELQSMFFGIDLLKFMQYNVTELFTKLGIDDGKEFIRLIRVIMKQKINKLDISFKELYKLTGKRLVITGSDITNCKECCFDYIETPDMSVIDAIRISISFALFFTPIEYNNIVYIDGAILDPYPIRYSEDIDKTLGLLIHDIDVKYKNANKNMTNFLMSIIKSFAYRMINLSAKDYEKNTVIISLNDNTFAMDFEITNELKEKYIEIGYNSTKQFMDNYYEKKRLNFLLKKYLFNK
jgi:predicted acylesterase/phospholipase RssA